MKTNNFIKIPLTIYAIFACLGISGIQIASTLSVIALLYLLITRGKINLAIDNESKRIFIILAIFIIWSSISTVFGIEIKSGIKKIIGLIGAVSLMIGCFNISNDHNESSKFIKKLLNILVVIAVIQSVYGIIQYFTGIDLTRKTNIEPYTRIKGTLGYFNSLGGVLGMILPIIFSLAITEKQSSKKLLYFSGFAIMLLALIFTFTRGAWLGAFAGIAFISIIKLKRRSSLLLILLLPIILLPPVRRRIHGTITSVETGRLYMWAKAYELIKEKPFLGYGYQSFKKLLYADNDAKVIMGDEGHFHPHNVMLTTMVETGIIGGLVLLFCFILIFVQAINLIKTSDVILGITGSLIDFHLHGLVDNVFSGETLYLFWFIVGILFTLKNSTHKTDFLK